MSYENILFDLDGTITKSERGIFHSIRHALNYFSMEEKDDKVLYTFIGPPLIESFEKVYGFTGDKLHEIIAKYREHYSTIGLFENDLYDGIVDVLKSLKKDHKLYVITTKPQPFAKKVLEYFDMDHYFEEIYGPSFKGEMNDKKELMKFALKNSDIDPQKSIMIGDRFYDMEAACANNVDALGVLYGYGDKEELLKSGAQNIVHTPSEIENIIRKK